MQQPDAFTLWVNRGAIWKPLGTLPAEEWRKRGWNPDDPQVTQMFQFRLLPEGGASAFAPCIQSGYCCSVAPCPFGEWDAKRGHCAHLLDANEAGRRGCARFNEIKRDPSSRISPAFGAGCCSPLNSVRRALLQTNPNQPRKQ